MPGTVLVVDDEEALRFFASNRLSKAGWEVYEAGSGQTALEILGRIECDVLLLDLRMGKVDGLTVMREVSQQWPEVVIIIMTAYASVESAIEAVRQGAFDYLRKPCSAHELVQTVDRAMAKKIEQDEQRKLAQQGQEAANGTDTHIIRSGQLAIEPETHTVSLADEIISLTPTEFLLLEMLARTPGTPVSLQQLIEEGLGYNPNDPQAQDTLRVHISRLRRKLEPRYIQTVRSGGYALAKFPAEPKKRV